MEQSIINIITAIGFPAAVAVAIGWMAWAMYSRTMTNMERREEKHHEQIEAFSSCLLEFGGVLTEFKSELSSVKDDISDLKGNVSELRTDVKELKMHMKLN